MNKGNVLVLGSKPEKEVLGIKFQKIYASNASIEKATIYKKINQKIEVNAVCTHNAFLNDPTIRLRVINAKPDRLIIRKGSIQSDKELNSDCIIQCFDEITQWDFQRNFFKFGFLSLILSELYYGASIKTGIVNLKKSMFPRKKLMGVSTGFFAILLAIHDNPDKNIYISGISMRDGGHFYDLNNNPKNVNERRKVDKFLINLLYNKYKKRMFSNDRVFANMANINYFVN
jgi:hypothetical protein|tara:strand:+ start:2879 stop:3568 length:690 start_codon:yes stop_codon:yes gene_type:complete